MNIVLVGEFSPPYDALTLYNLTLLQQRVNEGDQVETVDMVLLHEEAGSHFASFLKQLWQKARGANRIHYLTHGYDRTSIFYLFFAIIIAWLRGCAVDLTIHPELFAFFGPLRSHHVGKPLLRFCFHWANVIYCGNEAVAETVQSLGGVPEKCIVQPPLIPWPEEPALPPAVADFMCAYNPSLVVLFVGARSRFLRSEAVSLVRRWYGRALPEPAFVIVPEPGVDVCQIDDLRSDEYIVWTEPGAAEIAYLLSRAAVVIRPLQSMGQQFVPDYAFMLERPRRVGNCFDMGLGLTIIRKGKGLSGQFVSEDIENLPVPLTVRIIDLVKQAGEPKRALFLGAFSPYAGEETTFNQAICLELAAAGMKVDTIKMPQDYFDSQQTGSFFSFLGKINRLLKQNDMLFYSTQGFTRPSLLLLLGSTVLSKLRGKSVFVLFQRDAFSFFSQLRSRNAGLPLLFTAFSLADGILTMEEDAYHSALQYKNAPEKFHIVQPDLSLLPAEIIAEEAAPEDPVWSIGEDNLAWSLSAIFTDDTPSNGTSHVLSTLPTFQIRPLQCNGEFVAHQHAALIESAQGKANELDSAGVIVIPKEKPHNIGALFNR